MLVSCLLFALAAAMPLTGRVIRKGSLLLSFLCVLLCCAGVAAGVMSRSEPLPIAAGIAAVLLAVFLTPERSEKP